MGIVDGQPVDQANSNPAWIAANKDDSTVGILGLKNGATGIDIDNIQLVALRLMTATGVDETTNDGTTYGAPTSTIDDGDPHETALTKLANKFDNSTGHSHNGATGEGPQIDAAVLANAPLRGSVAQGIDLSTISGTSTDVSTELSGKSPSLSPAVLGVVVNTPENKILLRQASGADTDDVFKDGSGNIVYGRLTEAAAVWTLSFFVDLAGVETVYSFASPVDIRWYYQELFNSLNGSAPVYSEFANTPSDNTTADVVVGPGIERTSQGLEQIAKHGGFLGAVADSGLRVRDNAGTGVVVPVAVWDLSALGGLFTADDVVVGNNKPNANFLLATQPLADGTKSGFVDIESGTNSGAGDTGDTGVRSGSVASGTSGKKTSKSGAATASGGTTGDWEGGSGDGVDSATGDAILKTGATSGARGSIKLKDGSEGTIGQVWKSKGADGEGNWDDETAGGGGGFKSFIEGENSNLDDGIGDWLTYKDAVQATPEDGTGGVSTLVLAHETTNPLSGLGSLKITKPAATNNQGEGVSLSTIAIDDFQQGKPANLKLKFRTGAGYISNFYRAFLYDETGTQLKNVLNNDGDGSFPISDANGNLFVGSVNIPDGATFVRVILHAAKVDLDGFDFFVDDVKLEEISLGIFNTSGPVGEMVASGSTVTPDNFLYCDGASLLRSDYADLFSAIGTAYGAADGTHFNLPDLRGQFLRGQDDGATVDPDAAGRSAGNPGGNTGDNVGSNQPDAFDSHTHVQDTHNHTNQPGSINSNGTGGNGRLGLWGVATVNNSMDPTSTWSTGVTASKVATNQNTGGNETRPVNTYVRYYIRYKTESNVLSTTQANDRRVIARMYDATATTWATTLEKKLEVDTVEIDTHGGFSLADQGYKVVVPGRYRIKGHINMNSGAAATPSIATATLKVNGVQVAREFSWLDANERTWDVNRIIDLVEDDIVTMTLIHFVGNNRNDLVGANESFLEIERLPDENAFGVFSKNEFWDAQSSVKTPVATTHYLAMTGNQVTLGPGSYAIHANITYSAAGGVAYQNTQLILAGANGLDSGVSPAFFSSLPGVTLDAGDEAIDGIAINAAASVNQYALFGVARYTLTEPATFYAVPFEQCVTPANARISTNIYIERLV